MTIYIRGGKVGWRDALRKALRKVMRGGFAKGPPWRRLAQGVAGLFCVTVFASERGKRGIANTESVDTYDI